MGYTEWTKYCRMYAQQLRGDGLIHKAATYLLYTHDVDTAILWLSEANLYRWGSHVLLVTFILLLLILASRGP